MKKIARIIAFMFVLVLLFSTSAFAVMLKKTPSFRRLTMVLQSRDAPCTPLSARVCSVQK